MQLPFWDDTAAEERIQHGLCRGGIDPSQNGADADAFACFLSCLGYAAL